MSLSYRRLFPKAFCISLALISCLTPYQVGAVETPAAVDVAGAPLTDTSEQDRKDIETLLKNVERDWNAHDLNAVMANYANDYTNNDGLDKKAVSALTQEFWTTYPDAKSTSTTKQLRVEGNFATVSSHDVANGTTAKEMPGIGTKGELQSVSEGQLYLHKQANAWKIVGDRVDYETVKVAFGIARQLQSAFSAPEQVKAGKQYTSRLELSLASGLAATGSITNMSLQYPQPQPQDDPRLMRQMNDPVMEKPLLERIFVANVKNQNELLVAKIGITNAARNSLMGIAFLTRRVNVVPNMSLDDSIKTATDTSATTSAASNTK